MITQLKNLPEGLLKLTADQLHTKINNHTLVHLEGKIKSPVFISILQHGDEYTGWDALKEYLILNLHTLPRSISILFGNIEAARYNVRQLENQSDFNRAWPSQLKQDFPLAKTMQEITDIMQPMKPFASVDIHNNSGRNPHYSGINSLDNTFINLASLFSDTMIYFTSPIGIQSGAFAKFCPSVTVECGLSGTSDGAQQTRQFLDLLLNQPDLMDVPGKLEQQNVFKIVATVKVKPEIELNYDENLNGLRLVNNLDTLNFKHVHSDKSFGELSENLIENKIMPFVVTDENNNDLTSKYFKVKGNQIVSNSSFVPSMITQSISAIRQDCLCYIMQPIKIEIK